MVGNVNSASNRDYYKDFLGVNKVWMTFKTTYYASASVAKTIHAIDQCQCTFRASLLHGEKVK